MLRSIFELWIWINKIEKSIFSSLKWQNKFSALMKWLMPSLRLSSFRHLISRLRKEGFSRLHTGKGFVCIKQPGRNLFLLRKRRNINSKQKIPCTNWKLLDNTKLKLWSSSRIYGPKFSTSLRITLFQKHLVQRPKFSTSRWREITTATKPNGLQALKNKKHQQLLRRLILRQMRKQKIVWRQ